MHHAGGSQDEKFDIKGPSLEVHVGKEQSSGVSREELQQRRENRVSESTALERRMGLPSP